MPDLKELFRRLMTLGLPLDRWGWFKEPGKPWALVMGATMLADPSDPKKLVQENIYVQFPNGDIQFINVQEQSVNNWFELLSGVPLMIKALFILRTQLMQAVDLIENREKPAADFVAKVKEALGDSEEIPAAPSRIILSR
jgi:hypothetical protein